MRVLNLGVGRGAQWKPVRLEVTGRGPLCHICSGGALPIPMGALWA